MYDTETDELVQRDIITKKHQRSVLWLNGHSATISRQHYITKKKDDAVSDGRYVMNLILNKGRNRESHVDDSSRDDNNYRRGRNYDNSFDDNEGDYWKHSDFDDFDGDQGNSCDYDDNNDDIMYHQCEYESDKDKEEDKEGKWRDNDVTYGRDQDEECESKWYSQRMERERASPGDDSRYIRTRDDDISAGGGGRRLMHNNVKYGRDQDEECESKWYSQRMERERASPGDDSRYDDISAGGGGRRLMHRSCISPHTETDSNGQRRRRRISEDFVLGTKANNTNAIATTSMRRRSTDDRHERTHDYDLCTDDELEVLSPLPLRMAREAYVNWSDAEIEYARKAYDIIHAQLPPDQKRFIAKEILKHIRNDPMARAIFHPSHLENSAKFRHVIRKYVQR